MIPTACLVSPDINTSNSNFKFQVEYAVRREMDSRLSLCALECGYSVKISMLYFSRFFLRNSSIFMIEGLM